MDDALKNTYLLDLEELVQQDERGESLPLLSAILTERIRTRLTNWSCQAHQLHAIVTHCGATLKFKKFEVIPLSDKKAVTTIVPLK